MHSGCVSACTGHHVHLPRGLVVAVDISKIEIDDYAKAGEP